MMMKVREKMYFLFWELYIGVKINDTSNKILDASFQNKEIYKF
jgi:hypothetical protein